MNNSIGALDFLKLICTKPSIYVQEANFVAVCSFIDGYDLALSGEPLMGFKAWLKDLYKRETNLPWWGIVRIMSFPDKEPIGSMNSEESVWVLEKLLSLLEDYETTVRN